MPYVSSDYATQLWPFSVVGKKGPYTALTAHQASTLKQKAEDDARAGLYSALITLADTFRALEQQFYSWSAIKLYYLASFLCRTHLALDGVAMFHIGTYPRWCEASPGSFPQNPPRVAGQKGSETSHKMAFNLFVQRHPSSILLSQEIEAKPPPEWLQEQREYYNYRQGKFIEPDCPPCFSLTQERGVRIMLQTYVGDDKYTYTFDPDHALLAFPVLFLKIVRQRFLDGGVASLSAHDRQIVSTYWKDRFGPMNVVQDLM